MAAKHGGKRAGAGRPVGARQKATAHLKASLSEIAQEHTIDAVATLVEVMTDQEAPHSARITAANSILDRGYGKPQTASEPESPDEALPVTVTIGRRKAVGNVRVTGTE